jgi:tetratricopeptide (TPR) repeat protein
LLACTTLELVACAGVSGAGERGVRREIAQGDELAAAGKFGGAHRAFTRAIEADPASAEAYVKRAVCSILGRAFGSATKDLSEAIRLDPTLEEAYRLRAWVYEITGSWDGVIRDMRHVRPRVSPIPAARPNEAVYLNTPSVLGISQEQFRRVEHMVLLASEWEAAADTLSRRDGPTRNQARKPTATAPKDASGFRERGRSFILAHEFEKAAGDFDRAVEMGARDADTFLLRALARGRRGDLSAAVADLNRSIELSPASPQAFVMRGLAHIGLGENKAAIDDATRAIELDPRNPCGFYARSQAYFEMGDTRRGGRDAEEARALTRAESGRLWEYSSKD